MKKQDLHSLAGLKFPADLVTTGPLPILRRPIAPFGRLTLFAVMYCIVFWYLIEDVTIWGDMMHSWREEYFDDLGNPSGSMKLRGHEGARFYQLAFPYGVLVYPVASLAIVLLLRTAWKSNSLGVRIACFLLVGAMSAILGRFFYLGVFEVTISG